jgi:farnesyl diphosphate synthase
MTFEERLARRGKEIDSRLEQVLARSSGSRNGVPERLAQAMRHAVLSGGKRIRPFLLIESARLTGADVEAALPAAVALELVHCYSLVHDDLPAMDNDELRRGQPTVWKAFDDWTAILAGDALLTLAFEQLAELRSHFDPETVLVVVGELSRAAGAAGMVGGQTLDLEADKLGRPTHPSPDHIARLQAMKTGALFRFACLAGGVLGGAMDEEKVALGRFGEKLGAVFQLADDLLDVEGEPDTVGKATGKDAAAGKATMVGLLGLDRARGHLVDLERSAAAELDRFGERSGVLREALRFAARRDL